MVIKKVKNYPLNNKGVTIVSPARSQLEIEQAQPLRNGEIDWGDDSFEIEEFARSQKRIKVLVKNILEFSEEARGDDFILFLECIRLQYPNIEVYNEKGDIKITIPRHLIKFLKPESYRRWRQKFNANNEYLPSSPVILKRRYKEKVYKKFFRKGGFNEKNK